MANSVSARKRIRQNARARARNRWRKSNVRVALNELNDKILHGTPEEAYAAYQNACKVLDKTASKGAMHKNTAARKKSRLYKRLQARKG